MSDYACKDKSVKRFNMLNASSKFAICGLPLRVDSYKTCSFGCEYCFANNRKIMEFEKRLQIGDIAADIGMFTWGISDEAKEALIKAWNARADDAPEQPVDNAQADSRGQLEDEVTATVSNLVKYCGAHQALFEKAKSWLDRQDAITRRECETEFLDRAEVVITRREIKQRELQEQIDSLTAELQAERDTRRCVHYHSDEHYCDIHETAMETLRVDREKLQQQVDSLTDERNEFADELKLDAIALDELRKQVDELTAERDELQSIIDHMPKTEQECEACQDAHDRLMFNAKVHQDELLDELREKQRTVEIQRDSFLKLEAENAELRRMLADAAEAI